MKIEMFRFFLENELYADVMPSADSDSYDFYLGKQGYAEKVYMFSAEFKSEEDASDIIYCNYPAYIDELLEKCE